MKVLVLGGTRYIGKRLVALLAAEPALQVTLATRRPPAGAPAGVRWMRVDRTDARSLAAATAGQTWDLVYDQLCYTASDARLACEAFRGRVGRWVMASSQAVYPAGAELREEDFDPGAYAPSGEEPVPYGEGKRRAEAHLYISSMHAPVVAVRLPPVLGLDDAPERLLEPIRTIHDMATAWIEEPVARISLIDSADAARFLHWVRDRDLATPINVCSPGSVAVGDLVADIAGALQVDVAVRRLHGPAPETPYSVHTAWEADRRLFPLSVHSDWVMSPRRAMAAGFAFTPLGDWLPALVRALAARVTEERAGAREPRR